MLNESIFQFLTNLCNSFELFKENEAVHENPQMKNPTLEEWEVFVNLELTDPKYSTDHENYFLEKFRGQRDFGQKVKWSSIITCNRRTLSD